jgi:hypothetical protein
MRFFEFWTYTFDRRLAGVTIAKIILFLFFISFFRGLTRLSGLGRESYEKMLKHSENSVDYVSRPGAGTKN